MGDEPITRVQYFDGQYLRIQEFTDEQAYHVGMRRRHNVGGHIWGIVRGLDLKLLDPDKGQGPVLEPGMAIDGFGRELILVDRRHLDEGQFDLRDTDALDVYLSYGRAPANPTSADYGDCRAGTAEPDEYDRWLEEPILSYEDADPPGTDRRRPEAVAAADRDFGPERTPPDDPQRHWPVFLGRFSRAASSADRPSDYRYSVDMAGRPYAGLVGEAILAPSGRALVRIGDELSDEPPQVGFSVSVLPTLQPAKSDPLAFEGVLASLEIAKAEGVKDARITLRGEATLHGDLTLAGGSVEFRDATPDPAAPSGNAPPPGVPEPRPWAIARFDGFDPTATFGAPREPGPTDDRPVIHELRVVLDEDRLADDGETPLQSRLAVGAFDKDTKKFKPFLTVGNQKVVVHGDLVVSGEIRPLGGVVRGALTPQAQAQVTSAFVSGLTGKGTAPADLNASALEALKVMLGNDAGRKGVLEFLGRSNLIGPMLRLLVADPDGAKALVGSFADAQ